MTAMLGWTCPCGRHNAYRDVCLCGCGTPSFECVYTASQNAASPEEAELRARTSESGKPWEETVAGQMAIERYDARVADGENGGGFLEWLVRLCRKDSEK